MNYDKEIADIIEDLMVTPNWDYAHKEIKKLLEKAYMQGKIDEAKICEKAGRHARVQDGSKMGSKTKEVFFKKDLPSVLENTEKAHYD